MKNAWIMLLPVLLCCSKVNKPASNPHEIKVGNTTVKATMIKIENGVFPGNMNLSGDEGKTKGHVVFFSPDEPVW